MRLLMSTDVIADKCCQSLEVVIFDTISCATTGRAWPEIRAELWLGPRRFTSFHKS